MPQTNTITLHQVVNNSFAMHKYMALLACGIQTHELLFSSLAVRAKIFHSSTLNGIASASGT
jgi:hypothetical protein